VGVLCPFLTGNGVWGMGLLDGMAYEDVKQGGQGSVEFDESAEVGSVENRVSVLRSLVEDLNSSGESRFTQEITVDGRIWRVTAERLPG
jgi:hypothetical protein